MSVCISVETCLWRSEDTVGVGSLHYLNTGNWISCCQALLHILKSFLTGPQFQRLPPVEYMKTYFKYLLVSIQKTYGHFVIDLMIRNSALSSLQGLFLTKLSRSAPEHQYIRVSVSVTLLDSPLPGYKIAAIFNRRRGREKRVLLAAIQYLVGGILHSLLYVFFFFFIHVGLSNRHTIYKG